MECVMEKKLPTATIQTEHGTIVMELYPEQAPNTVNSFIKLAKEGVFDGQSITRIVPGFVIQPCFFLEDERLQVMIDNECSENGYANTIRFRRGTVAMGAEGNIASGASFFIALDNESCKRLQGKFPAFGQVLSGWEELDRLERVELEPAVLPDMPEGVRINIPKIPEKLLSVTVETWGVQYPDPVYLHFE